jgi:hypothetical protein
MLSSDGDALMPGTAGRNTKASAERAPPQRHLDSLRRLASAAADAGVHDACSASAQRRRRARRRAEGRACGTWRAARPAPRGRSRCPARGSRRGRPYTRTWLAQQALNLLRARATPRSVSSGQVCVTSFGTEQDAP